jgi:uncharacterized repeat protein (TIGR01451 family)
VAGRFKHALLLALPAFLSGATPNTVSLVSSPNPSNYGQVVTLTATVLPSNATGNVTFYDGVTVLGTSTISNGEASMSTLLLPAGNNQQLTAYYSGGGINAPSTSAPLPVTVTAVAGQGFASAVNYGVGPQPRSVAVGDFNGDGRLDLVSANESTALNIGSVSVLFGRGDGTFQGTFQGAYSVNSGRPTQVVVGDFNGDGKADLALSGLFGVVTIMLGNGDGTFHSPYFLPVGTSSEALAVGDFNGDGNADLAVADDGGSVYVLAGNGDGTFQNAVGYSAGTIPSSVTVGDFNGDGIADLAVANGSGFSVLLGNGDGTFQPKKAFAAGGTALAVAAGDVNGDGKIDLAVAGAGGLQVFPGNGDGTFGIPKNYSAGTLPASVMLADFNGDGIPDLAAADAFGGMNVLLGNGDGTFQSAQLYGTGGSASVSLVAAAGDFNGDGRTDIAAANYDNNEVSVLLALTPTPDLGISVTSAAAFVNNTAGDTFSITVTNPGLIQSQGAITVTDTLPAGLLATAIGGNGWNCTLSPLSCTASTVVPVGGSAPPITLTVSVLTTASSLTDSATVSGGGDTNPNNNTATDTVQIDAPVLTISVTHAGDFGNTQIGAAFAITVSNTGNAQAAAVFSVSDTLPAGMTATAIGGSGWTCTLSPLACTQSAILPAGSSFPPITLTVNVSASAASLENAASLAGIGTATDTVQIDYPDMTVAVSQVGSAAFGLGQTGAWTLTAKNAGQFSTSGGVTVADTLPAGFTAVSMYGAGWVCSLAPPSCVRTDSLEAGANYPPITLTANLPLNAPSSVTNSVTVSGGSETNVSNDTATDTVTVTQPSAVALTTASTAQDFALLGSTVTLQAALSPATASGKVTFYDGVNVLGTATAQPGVPATLQTKFLPSGVQALHAWYEGSATSTTAASNTDLFTVQALPGNGFFFEGPYNTGPAPSAVALGDFNNDGIPDLAVANSNLVVTGPGTVTLEGAGSVSILLGNGNGSFSAATNIATDYDPDAVLVGDLNGDGQTDIVVVNGSAEHIGNNPVGVLDVWLGRGDGTFQESRVTVAAPQGYNDPQLDNGVLGDFNRDGIVDLAVLDYSNGSVYILLGKGDGTFQAPVPYNVGGAPTALAMADFNGDGIADLVTANYNNSMGVLPGIGDGTFGSLVTYVGSGLAGPISIATGDFNGDGKVDVVVSNLGTVAKTLSDEGLQIFLGQGNGGFVAGAFYQASIALYYYGGDSGPSASLPLAVPGQIAVADLNGDGNQDLVFGLTGVPGAGGQGEIEVLLGAGDGTFGATGGQQYFVNGNSPATLAVADFNGDGTADVATALNDVNGVQVLLHLPGSVIALAVGQTVSPAQPDLSQSGTITISVRNIGTTGTSGPVTVTSTLSAGLSASAIGGQGWSCLGGLTCSRTDSLGGGSAYPDLTISFTVAANAPSNGSVQTYVSGGGDAYNAGNYNLLSFEILQPDLTVAETHSGDFARGETGARYDIVVSNSGTGATTQTVQVNGAPAAGLTVTSVEGAGWACTLAVVCTRSQTLAAGGSYPPITVISNVSPTTGSLTNTVQVSGGGELNTANDTASDFVIVLEAANLTLGSSANPAIFGQPVTLTASVFSTATGGVTFYDGTSVLGWGPIANGHATLTMKLLPAGARSLTAHYSGDASFGPNTSAVLTETVNAKPASGFQPAVTYGAGSNPQGVALADFNGDGKIDMAAGQETGSGIDILLGNGDGTFQGAATAAAGSGPQFLAAGDFNRDGKPDLAVTNAAGNTVGILFGNGDGTFQTQVSYATGAAPTSVAIADFNGDGIADLAIANATDGTVCVLLGNSDGTFQNQMTFAAGAGPHSVAAGDFNGDGVPDLAVANTNGTTVSILLGNGDGTFQNQVGYAAGSGPVWVVAGDLNGDGKADLAVADSGNFDLVVLLGNGDGTFGSPVPYAAPDFPRGVALGDFNGDGKMDIALDAAGNVAVYLGNGDGTFQAQVLHGVGSVPVGLAVADLNGDGRSDLVTANFESGNVSVLLGTPLYPDLTISKTHTGNFVTGQSGTFTITVSNATAAPTTALAGMADQLPAGMTATAIGGTGWSCTLTGPPMGCQRLDTLAGNASYPPITVTVTVAPGTTPVSLTNTAVVAGGGEVNTANDSAADTVNVLVATTLSLSSAASPIVGQFGTVTATITPAGANGSVTFYDGVTLLGTAALSGGQATVKMAALAFGVHLLKAVYPGNAIYTPSSTTLNQPIAAVSANSLGGASAFGAGTGPAFVATGDLNGDGIADLAVTNTGGNNISVLIGKGDGTFKPTVNYGSNGVSPEGIAIADLNGDGIPDLAVANIANNNVSMLIGNGDGTFQNATAIGNMAGPASAVAGDFNGDGIADLAFTNEMSDTVTVLLGNGGGTFRAPVTYQVASTPEFMVATDVNGDGIADLVTTSAVTSGNGVSVLIGNPDGTFQNAVGYAAGSLPAYIAVGDFNKDGKPDLAVVLNVALLQPPQTTNNVQVLVNKGDGTFLPPVAYTADSPVSIAVGDIDGDGNADLAVANKNGKVGVLLGNGTGTFGPATEFPAGSSLAGIAVADFNSDGRTDLAVADTANNDIAILLGQATAPTTSVLSATSPLTVTFGQLVTLTLTVTGAGFDPTAPTGAATLLTSGQTIANSSQTASPYTLTTPALFVGSHTLTASYGGDTRNGASTSNSITIQVNQATQTIAFNQPPAHTYGDTPFTPAATASSGLAVSFTSNSTAVCTAAGSTVTIVGAGSCSLTANQAGNSNYLAATTVTQTFTVNPASSTISFSSPGNQVFGIAPFAIAAHANSNPPFPVQFSSQTIGSCSVLNSLVTIRQPGQCTLTATQKGSGDFTAPPVAQSFTINLSPSGTLAAAAASPFAAGNTPLATVVADFNGDGKPDMAIANNGDNTVTVLLGDGTGGFKPVTGSPFAVGAAPVALVAADLNGDGIPDLAVANQGSGNVTVLLGDGAGGFTADTAGPFATGTGPAAIVTGDFDGDGRPDLAVANFGSGNVTVLMNRPPGFSSASFSAGNGPQSLGVADFNTDGNMDLAVASFHDGKVRLLSGDGTGSFTTGAPLPAGVPAYALAVGDFDGDNKQNLAIASTSGSVAVMLNGASGLTSSTLFTAPNAPFALVTGDFNGDGNRDVAVLTDAANPLTVLLGDGNGNLAVASAPAFPAGAAPNMLAVGDFNGDGRSDLAIPDQGNNTVIVLLGASALTSSVLSTTSPATVAAGAMAPLTMVLSDTGTAFASPTGTVTFMDNGKAIGTAAQSASPFTFTTAGLSAGSHTFTASYGGDARSAASASNAIVIDVPATVTNVTSTTANGTYGAGANIGIVVTFNGVVTVTGTPRLALNSGGSASYSSGSGTAALTFTYIVGAGQSSSRLDAAATAALTLNGGAILDANSVATILTLPAPGAAGSLGANSNIVIDGVAPTVTSYQVLWGSASYNVIGTTRNRLPWQIAKIRVVLSKPIAQAAAASLTGVTATALSGLGTSTLTWTITPIALGNFTTTLIGTGTNAIKDAAGNALAGGSGFSQSLKVLYGDVNDDGVVNSQDLVLVNNATKQPYNILMDMDGDGAITTNDVKVVQSRIGTSLP